MDDGEGVGSEKRAAVLWRTLKFDDQVDPKADVVATPDSPYKDLESIESGIERTKTYALEGRSTFTPTRVMPILEGEGVIVHDDTLGLAVIAEGFATERIQVYTRRIAQAGPTKAGMSHWSLVPSDSVRVADGILPGSAIVTVEITLKIDAGLNSEPAAGEVVELVIVDPRTGTASGTSVRITEVIK